MKKVHNFGRVAAEDLEQATTKYDSILAGIKHSAGVKSVKENKINTKYYVYIYIYTKLCLFIHNLCKSECNSDAITSDYYGAGGRM